MHLWGETMTIFMLRGKGIFVLQLLHNISAQHLASHTRTRNGKNPKRPCEVILREKKEAKNPLGSGTFSGRRAARGSRSCTARATAWGPAGARRPMVRQTMRSRVRAARPHFESLWMTLGPLSRPGAACETATRGLNCCAGGNRSTGQRLPWGQFRRRWRQLKSQRKANPPFSFSRRDRSDKKMEIYKSENCTQKKSAGRKRVRKISL